MDMDIENYYYELKTKCSDTVLNNLLEWCVDNMKVRLNPNIGFIQREAPLAIVQEDPLLNSLIADGWRCVIYRFIPDEFTQLHIDSPTNRPCTINILLGNPPSHTFFKRYHMHFQEYAIYRLVYKPNTAYLFNTLIEHAVLNLDQDRYLLTISPPRRYIDENYDIKHVQVNPEDINKFKWIYEEIRAEFKLSGK